MKKLMILILVFSLFNLAGCSIPTKITYSELPTFTQIVKKKKGGLGSKKSVPIQDLRQNQIYSEEIAALKEEAEKYIASHPDLDEATKNTLRELKIAVGNTKEEVELLLGEADKITKSKTYETWIYRINKLRAFTIFIFPVFFVHEGYYLRFKDNRLAAIERHFLEQTIHQATAPGITQKSGPKK